LISSAIYGGALNGNPLTKRLCVMVRNLTVKIDADVLCSMKVHGRAMTMPLSHALPIYLKEFPFYDRLLGRLAQFIRAEVGAIKCIDVGANVGDTIAALKEPFAPEKPVNADVFLAIEPNPSFAKCLRSNWGDDRSVVILPYICSSSEGNTSARISEIDGTASINLAGDAAEGWGSGFTKRTIDSIVREYKDRGDFNLLKIDTDGHDFEVLAGAKEFIANSLPFLYFEVDAFSNPHFVEDCLGTLEFLCATGYRKLFIYDNFGSLLGTFESDDVLSVKRFLFYKLTKKGYYFDFLLMRDSFVEEFYQLEIEYFANALTDSRLPQAV
jgi:FkbM family methyltransferase